MIVGGEGAEGGPTIPSSEREAPRDALSPQLEDRSLNNRRIGWLLLSYFVLRILLTDFLQLRGTIEGGLLGSALEFGMYGLIAAMFALARSTLYSYKVDRLSLILFIVFGVVVRAPTAVSAGLALELVLCAFSLIAPALAIVIIRSRHSPDRWAPTNLYWLGLGLVSGVALRLVVSALDSIATGRELSSQAAGPITAGGLLIGFLSFLGTSAVLEEPGFRGFFWGYLEDFRWKPVRIWLLQAALFWVAHLRYIDRPYTFWVAVPAAGLMFGWLSWRSRSIAASLLAHAAYNSVATYF